METRKKFFGVVKNVACLALAFVMAVTFVNPMTAQAKTKKVTLEPPTTANRGDMYTIASPVTTGKYKVNLKLCSDNMTCVGYMKFVAPATKKYSFTVSNGKGGKYGFIGDVSLRVPTERSWENLTVSTKGGKTNALWFANKRIKGKKTAKANICLPKRTGKVLLQEGQVVYIRVSMLPVAKKTKKTSCVIKIK